MIHRDLSGDGMLGNYRLSDGLINRRRYFMPHSIKRGLDVLLSSVVVVSTLVLLLALYNEYYSVKILQFIIGGF